MTFYAESIWFLRDRNESRQWGEGQDSVSNSVTAQKAFQRPSFLLLREMSAPPGAPGRAVVAVSLPGEAGVMSEPHPQGAGQEAPPRPQLVTAPGARPLTARSALLSDLLRPRGSGPGTCPLRRGPRRAARGAQAGSPAKCHTWVTVSFGSWGHFLSLLPPGTGWVFAVPPNN